MTKRFYLSSEDIEDMGKTHKPEADTPKGGRFIFFLLATVSFIILVNEYWIPSFSSKQIDYGLQEIRKGK